MKKSYFLKGLAVFFVALPVVTPLVVTLAAQAAGSLAGRAAPGNYQLRDALSLPLTLAAVGCVWWFGIGRMRRPAALGPRLAPAVAVFLYSMSVWLVCFQLAGYRQDALPQAFLWLTFPFYFVNLLLFIAGMTTAFPYVLLGMLALGVLCLALAGRKRAPLSSPRGWAWCALPVALMCCLTAWQFHARDAVILPATSAPRVSDEIYTPWYHPFDSQLLQVPAQPPSLSFEAGYPRLDGAAAALPFYAAVAQAAYKGLDRISVDDYVRCSATNGAYERLTDGACDVIFCAQPSKAQLALAAEKGVSLALTPIAREAFVFIANRNNPVDSLTIQQIRDIYQKRITNWRAVGGPNLGITPFQRPEDSGSQAIMRAAVMQGEPLPEPLREEYATGIGGFFSQVAGYRDLAGAIGYSFRFFVEQMEPDARVKTLRVDGVSPSAENVKSGAYPFTVDLYAVTAGTASPNARKLIDWILSPEGQAFAEQCGYVPLTSRSSGDSKGHDALWQGS